MKDQEREHLLQQVQDLERANRGWKLLAAGLAIALALMLLLGAAAGFVLQGKFMVGRDELLMERERALKAEEVARMQAEKAHKALRQAEEQQRLAEERAKGAQDRAGQPKQP